VRAAQVRAVGPLQQVWLRWRFRWPTLLECRDSMQLHPCPSLLFVTYRSVMLDLYKEDILQNALSQYMCHIPFTVPHDACLCVDLIVPRSSSELAFQAVRSNILASADSTVANLRVWR